MDYERAPPLSNSSLDEGQQDPFSSSTPIPPLHFFTPASSAVSPLHALPPAILRGQSSNKLSKSVWTRAAPPAPISVGAHHRYSPTKRTPSISKSPSTGSPHIPHGSPSSMVWSTLPPSPLVTPRSAAGSGFNSFKGADTNVMMSPDSDVDMASDMGLSMLDVFRTPISTRPAPISTSRPPNHPHTFLLTPPESSKSRPLPLQDRPIVPLSRPLQPRRQLATIKTTHLPAPIAPLTPPLTPPVSASALPSIQLVQSPPLMARSPTLSARTLAQHTLHPLFAAQYEIVDELGSGGFGFVVSATRLRDGTRVAVKFIIRAKVPVQGWVQSTHWGDSPGLLPSNGQREGSAGGKLVPMEAYVLRNIQLDGVVKYLDLFEDETYFYLVMEHHGTSWSTTSAGASPALDSPVPILSTSPTDYSYALASPTLSPSPMNTSFPPRPAPMERRSSCDLFECIEKHSSFTDATAQYIFSQVVEVVHQLDGMGVCHRDLKDENIVVDGEYRVKLIDFGSAVIFDPRVEAPYYRKFLGTTAFASAEILRGEPYQAPSSEIWALGVLLCIMLTGECPFVDASAAAAGRRTEPKIELGRDVSDLLSRCLELDVSRRITVGEMKRHPWLCNATPIKTL